MAANARRRFVQFPHPGAEHSPDRNGAKAWNPTSKNHARKFLLLRGQWSNGTDNRTGRLWAWGEWEPESELVKHLEAATPDHPRYLWNPYFVRRPDYSGLHNTDPFIFNGFIYSNCKQKAAGSLRGLRELDRGSVLLFGSRVGANWVMDTLLVISDFVDYDRSNHQRALRGVIPEAFWDVVLGPTYANRENDAFRLYRGATVDTPVDGMYSFFPCIPEGRDTGFPRPTVHLPAEYFSRGLLQGAKGHGAGPTDVRP